MTKTLVMGITIIKRSWRYSETKLRLFLIWCIFRIKRFNDSSVFIITSSPRSGSTWLGNMLDNCKNTVFLFEPLHLKQVPAVQRAGFDWRTYKNPNEEWLAGKSLLSKIFRGEIINEWIAWEIVLSRSFFAQRLIIKFVRATRLLPWICKNFNLPAPILLIRHPCAVIASQLKSSDWNNMSRPSIPPFLDDHPHLQFLIKSANSVEEYLAITWCLDYFPAFTSSLPYPWQIITYEELMVDPHKALDKIKLHWDFVSEVEHSVVNKPSKVTYSSGISGLDGWIQKLSSEQKEKIMHIVNAFGFTFYTIDSAIPDCDSLATFYIEPYVNG